jgi:predicted RecB family nuclease
MDENNESYKEIIDYNEVDCRVMWEIVKYLRKKHC